MKGAFMDNRTKGLIAIGASVTANCQPCLNYHVGKAREAGADENEISAAIDVAKAVRKGAMNKMDEFASTIAVGKETAAVALQNGCGCGCE
jgi:AhpD family alkylhydroperoxidase